MVSFDLRQGNSKELLKIFADNTFDSVVCDPPYELGFMGKSWDKSGIANDIELWREVMRVLKQGGHLLAFGGSITYHRMTCAIEDAGFEIRDCIMWVYGSGFPKSHNLDGANKGWGTGLKPAHEPIVMARKPFKGTVVNNVLAHGTGAINIDGCRVGVTRPPTTGKQKNFKTFTNKEEDFIHRLIVSDTNTAKGRWPANLVHDGSDEVVSLFPITAASRNGNSICKARPKSVAKGAEYERPRLGHDDNGGSSARFFYCAKAQAKDRHNGLDDNINSHPTVKPTDLMRYLVRLVTPPEGHVLDPFMGSGSTGKAARLEGFSFTGIDLSAEYVEIARKRIEASVLPLFSEGQEA